MFITASKDHTAKLFDAESLMLLKTYKTERPINSAAISPIAEHVALGIFFYLNDPKMILGQFISIVI